LISSLVVLRHAQALNDVAVLTPAFSQQWYAELWWWTKFLILPWAPEPLDLSILKHRHSDMKLVEYWVHNDSEAVNKFIRNAQNLPEFDDTVIVLRGVWANNTDTPFRTFQSQKNFQAACEDRDYDAIVSRVGKVRAYETNKLSTVFENLESRESLWGLVFDFMFLQTQKYVWDEYEKLWLSLSEGLHTKILKRAATTHTFLYHGRTWKTELHAAPQDDYFLQVANAKTWGFINKKYTPYIGAVKRNVFAVSFIMGTPSYFCEDYPEPGLPCLLTTLQPGDLMWFPSWHFHQVENEVEDFGLAFGIRTFNHMGFDEQFGPLFIHNHYGLFYIFMKSRIQWFYKKFYNDDQAFAKLIKMRQGKCADRYGDHFHQTWNGTHQVRYDYREVDGECESVQREDGYQHREILKEWHHSDWKPIS